MQVDRHGLARRFPMLAAYSFRCIYLVWGLNEKKRTGR